MTQAAKKLPRFEGLEVRSRELKLSGTASIEAGMGEPNSLDDELVVIGTFQVDKIGHENKPKRGLVRIESAGALELYVVTKVTDALDILQRARAEREQALDDLMGRQRLPMDDDGIVTDDGFREMLSNPPDGVDGETGEIDPEEQA